MTSTTLTTSVSPERARREAEYDSDVQDMAATVHRTAGRSDVVVIFDDGGGITHRIGPEHARAFARLLHKLADHCENTGAGRSLRRPTGVDEHLRDRDV